MPSTTSTAYALFAIRISLLIFMLMWAVFKIMNPASCGVSEGGSGIFGKFYGIELGEGLVYIIGFAQILFLLAFGAGVLKLFTTGGVFLMNLATLVVSLPSILTSLGGEGNLLFAASFPVLGASLALFLMRDQDTFLSFGASKPGT